MTDVASRSRCFTATRCISRARSVACATANRARTQARRVPAHRAQPARRGRRPCKRSADAQASRGRMTCRCRAAGCSFPGDQDARRSRKAFAAIADVVIVDLEDAVGPTPERKATRATRHARTASPRIPSTARAATCGSTGWRPDVASLDLAAASPPALRAWCCRSARDRRTSRRSRRCSMRRTARPTSASSAIVTETARGLQCLSRLPRSAAAARRADVGRGRPVGRPAGHDQPRGRDGAYLSTYVRARATTASVAARAVGVSAIDAVYPDFRDVDGLGRETACPPRARLRREVRDPSGATGRDRRRLRADRGRSPSGPSASSPRSPATARSCSSTA